MARYTDADIQFILDNYGTMKIREIAAHLGRTENTMQKKLIHMGLTTPKPEAAPHINTVGGLQYWRIAIGKKRYYIHRMNFEAKYGPVPDGFKLKCKDGNTLNAEADNWELISKGDMMRNNLNPEGTSSGLKKLWAKVKLREAYGRPVHFSKYRSKRIKTRTPVLHHSPNSYATVSNI